MPFSKIHRTILLLLAFFACHRALLAQVETETEILLGMRMIGHQVLWLAGDSSSNVPPVEKEGDKYRITFATSFEFVPEELAARIDSAAKVAQLPLPYIVEVVNCIDQRVVYSYKKGSGMGADLIPCQGRLQAIGCYELLITLLTEDGFAQESQIEPVTLEVEAADNSSQSTWIYFVALLFIVLLIAGNTYFRKRRRSNEVINHPDFISIGKFHYDQRNMQLWYEEEKTELTSKEGDLLLLLFDHANSSLKREAILEAVWGDEGDYVGRTLDVFVSKLRKKLKADPDLKIVNIRGVGYKLITND